MDTVDFWESVHENFLLYFYFVDDDPGDAPMAYASTVIPSETAVAYAGHTEDDYNRMEDLLHDIFDDKVASFLVPRKKSRS